MTTPMQEFLKWVSEKYEIHIPELQKNTFLDKERIAITRAWEDGALAQETGLGFIDGTLYFENTYLNDAGSR
jgi:hypothetical protein